MDEWVGVLLGTVGGAGGALLIAAFLGKRWVEHQLEKALKDHEVRLTERAESLKMRLSILAHEQQIALTRMDADRATAIKTLYAALKRWSRPTSNIVAGCPLVEPELWQEFRFYIENAEEAHTAGKALADTLSENAIYFDSATYEQLAETVNESLRLIAKFLRPLRETDALDLDREMIAPHMLEERKALVSLWKRDIAPLHLEVTTRFRHLLGVE